VAHESQCRLNPVRLNGSASAFCVGGGLAAGKSRRPAIAPLCGNRTATQPSFQQGGTEDVTVRIRRIALGLAVAGLGIGGALLIPQTADATFGYYGYGYGTKAKGMGGAGTALALDPLAGLTNPASLVHLGNVWALGVPCSIRTVPIRRTRTSSRRRSRS
jgi:hypothetical protein